MRDLTYSDYEFDKNGVLKQKDLYVTANYDSDYVETRYTNGLTITPLNHARINLLKEFKTAGKVLDFGCGAGSFVNEVNKYDEYEGYGYDISPYKTSFKKLTQTEVYTAKWDVVTFFDSLEHTPNPEFLISQLHTDMIIISVPECHFPHSEQWFMSWKHRRQGEHLWHFNRNSLDKFMHSLDYKCILHSNLEDKVRTPYCWYLSNILTAIYV